MNEEEILNIIEDNALLEGTLEKTRSYLKASLGLLNQSINANRCACSGCSELRRELRQKYEKLVSNVEKLGVSLCL